MKKHLLLYFLCIILLCGCSHSSAKSTVPPSDQQKFDTYTRQYFDEQMKSNGLNLHFYLKNTNAYPDADMTLGTYSYDSMKTSQNFWIEQIKQLKQINPAKLSKKRRLTYDVLLDYFQRKLDFSDVCICTEDLSPTLGIQAQLPVIFSEYEFSSAKDIIQYFSLLKSIGPYYDGICQFQREKARQQCFIGKSTCGRIIAQCQAFLNGKAISSNLLSTSFSHRISHCDFLSSKEKEQYTKQNNQIIKDTVFPAYETLIHTLTDLMEDGSCKNENGLYYLKKGKAYYEYLVQDYTGCNKSIPEIKAEIQNTLLADIQTLQKLLQNHPELETKMAQALPETSAPQIMKELQSKISRDFPAMNSLPFQLKYVDAPLQKFLSPAFYISPPLDDPDNHVIYINPGKKENLYTLLAHEGIPGHMYQNAFFSKTNPNPIRFLLECGGYSEGWALYTELFSYSYQLKDPNLAKLFQINARFSLALYCLCDIGIHYEGWTRKDLEKFLRTYQLSDRKISDQMFQAVLEDPANYLKYYVGYLEIINLQKTMQKTLGKDFSLKEFHRDLLTIGPAGFTVLQKWMLPQK